MNVPVPCERNGEGGRNEGVMHENAASRRRNHAASALLAVSLRRVHLSTHISRSDNA